MIQKGNSTQTYCSTDSIPEPRPIGHLGVISFGKGTLLSSNEDLHDDPIAQDIIDIFLSSCVGNQSETPGSLSLSLLQSPLPGIIVDNDVVEDEITNYDCISLQNKSPANNMIKSVSSQPPSVAPAESSAESSAATSANTLSFDPSQDDTHDTHGPS